MNRCDAIKRSAFALVWVLGLTAGCSDDSSGSAGEEGVEDTGTGDIGFGGTEDASTEFPDVAGDDATDSAGEGADVGDVGPGESDGGGAPPGYATLSIWVDDTANQTFDDAQITWTGSFAWDADSNTIVFSSSWLPEDGPYPLLYDDGPISEGGHEMAGAVAGDSIFSTEVYFEATETTMFEYGLLNELDNWMWVGPNGILEVPQGSTERYDLEGQVLPVFGDVDVRVTVDTASLHPDFLDPPPTKVFLKGTLNMWAPIQILDDGSAGDETADDGIYTYVHSTKLGPHDGLLSPGQEAQFVFVFTYGEDATAEQGLEYKIAADASPDGVAGYTDFETPGEWVTTPVYLAPDSKGKTQNTALRVPGEPIRPDCSVDDDCPNGTCQGGQCVPDRPTGDGPVVLLLEPANGAAAGGTPVQVYGSGFMTDTTIAFGTNLGTAVTLVSDTELTVTTPPGAAGTVDVTATNPDGQSNTFPNGFNYIDIGAAPSLTGIEPATGSASGGTEVVLSGANLQLGAIVSFGGVATTAQPGPSFGTLSAVVPVHPDGQHPLGSVDVTLTNPDGQDTTLIGGFEFVPDAIDWGSLVGDVTHSLVFGADGPSIAVEVYEPGKTDSEGPASGLLLELGSGPDGTDPSVAAGWSWQPMTYVGESGNNDVWEGKAAVAEEGTFDIAARATLDAGDTWVYLDANGTADGYAPVNAGSLTVLPPPTEPTVLGLSPQAGSVAGGTEVVITGVLLDDVVGATVGGVSVEVTTTSSTVTLTTPAADAGPATIVLSVDGGADIVIEDPFYYGLVLTPSVDGALSDGEWSEAFSLAANSTPTIWGEGQNELFGVWAAFDSEMFYVAVDGVCEGTNAISIFIDIDYGAGTGVASMADLGDNDGLLDDALSGVLAITDGGFGAEFAAGTVGMASYTMGEDLGLANAAGWRLLDPLTDFAWLNGSVVSGSNAIELALPLEELFGSAGVTGPTDVGVVVRLGNQFGDFYSNQGLPDAVSGEANTTQSETAVFTVYPTN